MTSGNGSASETFYATIVANTPEAIIVTTPAGEITYINRASERLLGYTPDEVIGKNITMLVPQTPGRRADPVKWLQRWAAEPDYTQSRFLDLIGQTKSGHEMPVDVRVVEINLNARPHFIITVRDNTARRAEQAAFRDANLKATRILMIAEDAIVSVDRNLEITFFNLKAEKVFGYKADEILGQSLNVLLPERFRSDHAAMIEKFGKGKVASQWMSQRGTITGLRKNGQEFPAEATITKVGSGNDVTYSAHLRDLTEPKRSAES